MHVKVLHMLLLAMLFSDVTFFFLFNSLVGCSKAICICLKLQQQELDRTEDEVNNKRKQGYCTNKGHIL